MKLVFVLFDSLNRKALEPYGGTYVKTPNFNRFAEKAITFDKHYVGSLPCMPARRDMHTGRINFLHRNWGPLEPFDNSFPDLIKSNGGYGHIITDHYHYFHDGGATYHTRYNSWEIIRGASTDDWKGIVEPNMEKISKNYHKKQIRPFTKNDLINRTYKYSEEDFSCPQIFCLADDFLDVNSKADNWLLQIESFDPHEPFYAPKRFRKEYPCSYEGAVFDWPMYDRVDETSEEIAEVRANYAAITSMCDEYFGKLLDKFDKLDLWEDTALILTTDHGFLLGEHEWWGKNLMPVYDELARIPLMIYHPDYANNGGEMRHSLTQVTDLTPTVLEWFGVGIPSETTGKSLSLVLERDQKIRDTAIYGYFGAACNITDGRYTYLRYPKKLSADGLYEYTLMPTRFGRRFSIEELIDATLSPPFNFTKGVPTLKVYPMKNKDGEASAMDGLFSFKDAFTRLYDTKSDPKQANSITNNEVEERLCKEMHRQLLLHDAPDEIFKRLGLEEITY